MAEHLLRSRTSNTRFFDGSYESDEEEFDKIFGITPEQKREQSAGSMPKTAADLALDPERVAETARRMSTMNKRVFDDAGTRIIFDESPTPKRTRRGSVSFSPDSPSNNASFAFPHFGQESQIAATSSVQVSDLVSLQPTVLSVPRDELDAIQPFSESSERDIEGQKRGENIELRLDPESPTPFPKGSQIAPIAASTHTQDVKAVESSSSPQMQTSQDTASNSSPVAHQDDNIYILLRSGKTPQQAPTALRRSTRRGKKYGQQELTAFPPFMDPLPPNLSLEEICRDYPNHLNGRYLRRFIDEGWTGKAMWEAMQESAKRSASTTRPWNKFEHRIIKEKRLMSREQENSQCSKNTASPGNLNSDAALPTGAPNTGTGATTHAPGSDEARMNMYHDSFKEELAKQKAALALLLSADDSEWYSRSQQEISQRIEEEWIRRAKRLERAFATNHDLDVRDLQIEQTSAQALLKRFNILLKMSQSMTSGTEDRFAAFQEQLETLQGWTAEWHEQLERRTKLPGGRANQHVPGFWSPTLGQSTGHRPARSQADPIVHSQRQSMLPAPKEPSSWATGVPAQRQVAASQGSNFTQTDLSALLRTQYQQHQYADDRLQHSDPNLHQLQYAALGPISVEAGNMPASQESGPHFGGQNPAMVMASQPSAPELENEFSFEHFLENDDTPFTKWYGEGLQDDE